MSVSYQVLRIMLIHNTHHQHMCIEAGLSMVTAFNQACYKTANCNACETCTVAKATAAATEAKAAQKERHSNKEKELTISTNAQVEV